MVDDASLLVEFWHYAGQLPHANRAESCAAVLASILADMRSAGSYPVEDVERRRLLLEVTAAFRDEQEARRAAHRRYYFAPPKRRT